ncbi:hypothetical protein [Sulfurimonas sp.]
MKKLLLIFIAIIINASEIHQLKYDLDLDNKKDTIRYKIDELNPRNAKVTVEINATRAKNISFEMDTYVNFEIEQCNRGCIKVINADWGVWADDSTKFYYYSNKRKSWFLKTEIVESPYVDKDDMIVPGKRNREIYHYDMSQSIDGSYNVDFDKYPLSSLEFRAKYYDDIFKNSISKAYLQCYLDKFKISKKTVTRYNNTAYYLLKHKNNNLAIFLLNAVLKKFPKREVAYLNLADAYSQINPAKSLFFYRKYIQLMKQEHKEQKIPNRVFKALK